MMQSAVLAEAELHVITENWIPYNYEDRGELKGEATVNVIKTLERAGIDYQLSIFPWSRAYRISLKKKNVLIFTLVRMPAREDLFIWSRPVLDKELSAFYRLKSRTDIKVDNIDAAKNYKIGVVKDSMNHLFMKGKGLENNLIVVSTEQKKNVHNLIQGDIDLMAASDKTFIYSIKQLGANMDIFERVFPLFEINPYMAFSLGTSPDLINKINQAYDELVEEGQIQRFK